MASDLDELSWNVKIIVQEPVVRIPRKTARDGLNEAMIIMHRCYRLPIPNFKFPSSLWSR